jgi:hypothetical protein
MALRPGFLKLGQDCYYHTPLAEQIGQGRQPVFVAKIAWVEPNGLDFTVALLGQSGWENPIWSSEGFGPGQCSDVIEPE